MSGDPTPVPAIDTTTPSLARAYDYLLGGKDNYEVDRQVVEMLRTVAPEASLSGRMNRAFGKRAVRYIAEQGIRQFIDLGSGIPTTPPSVHDAAHSVDPAAHVVYVDIDRVVVAYSLALRSSGSGVTTILADIRRPETVLDHPELQANIDFNEPVGVVIFSVLDVIEDKDNPLGIVKQFRQRMAPGSYLGISHLSARSAPDAIAHAHKISQETGFPAVAFRSDEEVLRFFDGFDLVEPGLVDVREWHPEQDAPQVKIKLVGAVGRKTG
ncbi:MAG TPA: SAM-dependent methyltransferase [Streptosporangiaceae bacterium]|nr:SAM-dependent methyltransferase [Streptosporangiaceae bacterium]